MKVEEQEEDTNTAFAVKESDGQYIANVKDKLEYDDYKDVLNLAKKHGGDYKKGKGFVFDNEADLNEFVEVADALLGMGDADTQGFQMITAPEGVKESPEVDAAEQAEGTKEEKPSSNRKCSIDNSDNKIYNRIVPMNANERNDAITRSVVNEFNKEVQRLVGEGWTEEQVSRALNDENSDVRKAILKPWIREYNQYHAKNPDKKALVNRAFLGEDVCARQSYKAIDKAYQTFKDRVERMMDDAKLVYAECVDARDRGQAVIEFDSWRAVKRSNARHGGTAQFKERPGNHQNSIRPTSRSEKSGFSIARSMDELKAEAKEAFPGAKVQESGNKLIFTMPNGQKITFTFHESITVSDDELSRAKREHGIDQRVTVTVEGYAESVDGEGFGALSRQKHSNFAKLWQKIADVAAKMAGILGYETKRNLFRKVESGEIYKSDNTAKDTEKKYSVNSSEGSSEESFFARATDTLAKKMGVKPISDRVKVDERPSRD